MGNVLRSVPLMLPSTRIHVRMYVQTCMFAHRRYVYTYVIFWIYVLLYVHTYIRTCIFYFPLYTTLRTLAELSHQVEFSTKEFSRLQEKLEQNYKRELVEREEALKLHEESLKGSSEHYTMHAYVLSMFSSNKLSVFIS